MTSFFPDVNVWLALSVAGHVHNREAWNWFATISRHSTVVFCRFTQLALLRLLVNESAMGDHTLNLRESWKIYDQWMLDPRVEFYSEPSGVDATFRQLTGFFASQQSPKAIGDCWVLAFAKELRATLVTFDRGLIDLARKDGHAALIPA